MVRNARREHPIWSTAVEQAQLPYLIKWIPQNKIIDGDRSKNPLPATPLSGSASAIDATTISDLRELLSDDFNRILTKFIEDASLIMTELGDAWSRQDIDQVAKKAHALKSPCRQVGALAYASILAEIERCAYAGYRDAIPNYLHKAQETLPDMLSAIADIQAASIRQKPAA